MRTCILVLLAIGCGDDGGTNGVKDMSTPVLKDLTMLNADCDVAMQNCAAGQKCVGFFDGTSLVGTCVTDGTVAAGGACQTQQSQDTLLDNCVKGYVCDNLFGNSTNTCRKILRGRQRVRQRREVRRLPVRRRRLGLVRHQLHSVLDGGGQLPRQHGLR